MEKLKEIEVTIPLENYTIETRRDAINKALLEWIEDNENISRLLTDEQVTLIHSQGQDMDDVSIRFYKNGYSRIHQIELYIYSKTLEFISLGLFDVVWNYSKERKIG